MKYFTTCVNYADLLDVTLPAWCKLGDVYVITRKEDDATKLTARQHGAEVLCTPAWFEDSIIGINKGAAMNDTIKYHAQPDEQIVLFDSDCWPIRYAMPIVPDTDTIISCRRFNCESGTRFHLARDLGIARLSSRYDELGIQEIFHGSYRPNLTRGYFQTFLFQERLTFGRKRDTTFSGCDLWISAQFAYNQIAPIEQIYMLHLGKAGVNWKGRITPRWQ